MSSKTLFSCWSSEKNNSRILFFKKPLRQILGVDNVKVISSVNYINKAIERFISLGKSSKEILELQKLKNDGIIDFIPKKSGDTITYLKSRPTSVKLDATYYNELIHQTKIRKQFMIEYVSNNKECREIFLLRYFGESTDSPCNQCDICRIKAKNKNQYYASNALIKKILILTQGKHLDLQSLVAKFDIIEENDVMSTIKWLLENHYLIKNKEGYTWKKNQE